MLSKLLTPSPQKKILSKYIQTLVMVRQPKRVIPPVVCSSRRIGGLIPPDQYDYPISRKFRLGYAMRVHWEIVPVVLVCAIGFFICFLSICYQLSSRVDVVYSTHNVNTISRTMDLRNPRIVKLLTINQRYDPWPEMQDVLDKMRDAEHRALTRGQNCNIP